MVTSLTSVNKKFTEVRQRNFLLSKEVSSVFFCATDSMMTKRQKLITMLDLVICQNYHFCDNAILIIWLLCSTIWPCWVIFYFFEL